MNSNINKPTNLENTETKETKETTKPKYIIPDQLNIMFITSIPGKQNIRYKPSMSIENSSEKGVIFDPKTKLIQSKIDEIPSEYRIKGFLNKDYFQSMLSFNGEEPTNNIYEIKDNINNNIQVTINTLFSTGNVLYIKDEPYSVADFQWQSGDWDINYKEEKQEIDKDQIQNPLIRAQLEEKDFETAEEQLKNIPKALLVGDNFTGEHAIPLSIVPKPPIIKDITEMDNALSVNIVEPNMDDKSLIAYYEYSTNDGETFTKTNDNIPIEIKGLTNDLEYSVIIRAVNSEGTPSENSNKMTATPKGISNALVPVKPPPSPPVPEEDPPEKKPLALPAPPSKEEPAPPPEENPPALPALPAPPPEQDPPEENTNIQDMNIMQEKYNEYLNKLKYKSDFTSKLRKYFISTNYKNIIDIIFQNIQNKELKKQIRKYYDTYSRNTNKSKTKISYTSYKGLVNQISIIKAIPDGNCFFEAVSKGINIHNSQYIGSQITYGFYGKTELFTINILREIVFDYFVSLHESIKMELFSMVNDSVNDMNNSFNQLLEKVNVNEEDNIDYKNIYNDIITSIFHNQVSFLITYNDNVEITKENIKTKTNPFRVLEKTNDDIKNYFMSRKYWANEIAFQALCKTLNINIIPIEENKINKTNESANKQTTFKLLYNFSQDSSKNTIMFLYYSNSNHYDLVRFGFEKQKQIKYCTIFDINTKETFISVPPMHILLLIYGTLYWFLTDELKEKFLLYKDIMHIIEVSVKRILENEIVINKTSFNDIFKRVFPNNKKINDLLQISQTKVITQQGGDESSVISKPQIQTNSSNSKLAYSVRLFMELYPGKELPQDVLKKSKCNSKLNTINKNLADLTGKKYLPKPIYPDTDSKKEEGVKEEKIENRENKITGGKMTTGKTRKRKKQSNGKTCKIKK